ncbi:MAG TPA: potassium channel family protein, partial [Phenylobacterium sp.]|nr:potassium channel family protein [Phenylobacterium sp.]
LAAHPREPEWCVTRSGFSMPDHDDHKDLSLKRRGRSPAWLSLAWRISLAGALIAVAVAVHWFYRAGLRDANGGPVGLLDVIYFTIMTVTTVGYGDIVPVSPILRAIDTFGLTPIRILLWLIFLGTAYEFLFKNVWERWRMSMIQRTLTGHVIVAGYGVSGREAVGELRRHGTDPGRIVVIDEQADALAAAAMQDVTFLAGDATRDATLEAARVDKAKAILVDAGRDDTSILIVLTARRLAPKVAISVVIRSADNEALARQAGAGVVINPASFAGQLMASSSQGAHVADFMADLAASGGAFTLRERPVAASEVGRPISALGSGVGLQLCRDGSTFNFASPEAQSLERDDMILEVVAR